MKRYPVNPHEIIHMVNEIGLGHEYADLCLSVLNEYHERAGAFFRHLSDSITPEYAAKGLRPDVVLNVTLYSILGSLIISQAVAIGGKDAFFTEDGVKDGMAEKLADAVTENLRIVLVEGMNDAYRAYMLEENGGSNEVH